MIPRALAVLSLLLSTVAFAQAPPPIHSVVGTWASNAFIGDVRVAPAIDRIFFIHRQEVIGYRLSTFAAKTAAPERVFRSGAELVPPDYLVAPLQPSSGWRGPLIDALSVTDYDHDRRGFVYIAFSFWGVGITDLNGTLLAQIENPNPNEPRASSVEAIEHEGRFYALITFSGNEPRTFIYDVTTPAAPALVRTIPRIVDRTARTLSGDVAVAGLTSVEIFTPAALLSGGAPKAVMPVLQPLGVVSDGTYFHVLSGEVAAGQPNAILRTYRRDGDTYILAGMRTFPNKRPVAIDYRAGYLTLDLRSVADNRLATVLLRLDGTAFDLESYLNAPFSTTFRRAVTTYASGGQTYFVTAQGIGRLFTIASAPDPLTPIPALPPLALAMLAAVIVAIAFVRLR